jgi:murein DD-endopeptidase MepM/ murein hydrolase activator NlpD
MADPDTFRVSPSLQNLQGVSAPPVESAGPSMLVKAGESITRAAGVGVDIYRAELRELNATRVTEGLAALTNFQHDLTYGDGGWASQQGRNALERPDDLSLDEEFIKRFDERSETISLGLGNDAQRTLFRQRAIAMGTDLRGRIQSHVAQQNVKYQQDTLTGVIETNQMMMGTATDPIDIARARDTTLQAATRLADMQGVPDEARDTFYREMLTPGHLGALSRLTSSEDIEGAEAYFNEHRDEMTYEATVKMEAGLLEQRSIMTGGEIGEQIAGMAGLANTSAAPQAIVLPVTGAPITSEFGPRGGRAHKGIDIGAAAGTSVHAGASGVASIKDDPDGFGTYIELKLDDGTKLRYAHLSGVDIQDGDRVNAGQIVGRSGGARGSPGAGNSTGPHLHYEVIGPDGAHVDPVAFHNGRPTVTPQNIAGMSLQDQLSQLYGLNLPPRVEAEAERKIRSLHGARREEEAERKDEIVSRAFIEIDRTGTLSNASRSAIAAAGMGSTISSLRSFEEATRDRREGKTIPPEMAIEYYGLARQMIADGRINSAEDLLQLKPYLPNTYMKQLIDDVTGDAGTARQQADTTISMMNEEVAGSGLFVDEDGKQTTETKREYSRFVGAVTRQIEAERANGPVSLDRQREIVLGMVGRQVISATGERTPGYQIRQQYDRIPAAQRLRIVRGLQRNNIPVPSQAQVVSAWQRASGQ